MIPQCLTRYVRYARTRALDGAGASAAARASSNVRVRAPAAEPGPGERRATPRVAPGGRASADADARASPACPLRPRCAASRSRCSGPMRSASDTDEAEIHSSSLRSAIAAPCDGLHVAVDATAAPPGIRGAERGAAACPLPYTTAARAGQAQPSAACAPSRRQRSRNPPVGGSAQACARCTAVVPRAHVASRLRTARGPVALAPNACDGGL